MPAPRSMAPAGAGALPRNAQDQLLTPRRQLAQPLPRTPGTSLAAPSSVAGGELPAGEREALGTVQRGTSKEGAGTQLPGWTPLISSAAAGGCKAQGAGVEAGGIGVSMSLKAAVNPDEQAAGNTCWEGLATPDVKGFAALLQAVSRV